MARGQVPTVVVLLAVAVGLGLVVADWRLGSNVVGLGVLLAAALRLGLPERAVGMLAVRGRTLDAVVLLALGAGLLLLANTVPRA